MNLYGPVRADKSVGMGKAAVTLSMKWKDMPVASTRHVLTVSDSGGGTPLAVSSRLIRSLPHPDRKASASHVQFTPKGTLFVAGYPSGVIQVWDTKTGKELRRIESPSGYRGSADYALTPDDFGTLFVPQDGRKYVPNKDPKKPGRREYNGKVLVWDLATGKEKPSLKAQPGYGILSGHLSPDGGRIITTERSSGPTGDTQIPDLVRMTDTATGKSWNLAEGYGMATFSADGKRAYLTVIDNGTGAGGGLLVFDSEGKPQPALIPQTKQRLSFPTLSPDGKYLAVNESKGRINQSGSLKVIDLASGKIIAEFASGGDYPFLSFAFSPDGRLLAASDYDSKLRVFDVAKKSVVLEYKFEGMNLGEALAFSPDGKRLAVPARVKSARVRDPDPLDFPQPRVYLFDLKKKASEEIVCPHGWAGGIAFSADGKTLAFGGAGAVHLFDMTGPVK